MINLIVTFIVLYFVIYLFHSDDEKIWLRALFISLTFIVGGLIIVKFGIIGWVISLILEIVVVVKVMQYNIGTAFLFLIAIGIIQQIVSLGLDKFVK